MGDSSVDTQFSTVLVLIPTLNESDTIGGVIESYFQQGFSDVFVVDGGSSDDTRRIAEKHGARVSVQTGEGKGQAVRQAFESTDSEYVLMVDGDGTYAPEDAEKMLLPLFEGHADHTVGDRFSGMNDDAMSVSHRLGNRVVNQVFSMLHGAHFTDILSGYHAFTREFIDNLQLDADGFEIETELAVESARVDFRTEVIPIEYRARLDSSKSNLHPVKDGVRILWTMVVLSRTQNQLSF